MQSTFHRAMLNPRTRSLTSFLQRKYQGPTPSLGRITNCTFSPSKVTPSLHKNILEDSILEHQEKAILYPMGFLDNSICLNITPRFLKLVKDFSSHYVPGTVPYHIMCNISSSNNP